jgi:superkiller protein 8
MYANFGAGQDSAIRALAFSPASTLLAAGGDAKVISLFDVNSGEQIANLTGHASWIMSLDFSSTGEWLLSGCVLTVLDIWFLL